jgi:hypothetical protein
MHVDISDTSTHQRLLLDEFQHLGVGCNRRVWQPSEKAQNLFTIADISARELANDERVNQDLVTLEQGDEVWLTSAKVIDPDRSVDENHDDLGLLLGIAFNPGSVPPSLARRLALSRAISAFKPS